MTNPLDAWVLELATELGIDPTAVDRDLLLDVARESAHGVARPAAPLTTFLVGLAAGQRGGDLPAVREAATTAQRLATEHASETAVGAIPDEPTPETGSTAEPSRRKGMLAEWRDAVTPRAFGLVVGVLLLQLAFILSYAGAFHDPKPHRMTVGVVVPAGAPAGTAQQTVAKLNAIKGEPLHASIVRDAETARKQIKDRDLDGALILGSPAKDQLLVASAEGGSLSSALQSVLTTVDASQHHTLTVEDVVPAAKGDARGLTAFYLAVGWVVGGYLVASILAISAGALPSNVRRARVRLGALLAYSIVSGLGGALIVGPILGALTGSFWTLSGFGALVVFAVGAFTMAIQAVTGVVGIGIAVLLFVVLGNPSAGGAYPGPLLPAFWRAIGPFLPPGAGTTGIRGIIYFGNADVGAPAIVVLVYAVIGAAALLGVSRWRPASSRRSTAASAMG